MELVFSMGRNCKFNRNSLTRFVSKAVRLDHGTLPRREEIHLSGMYPLELRARKCADVPSRYALFIWALYIHVGEEET